ncbi:unnamed protein product [Urochloa humidicola]
MKANTCSSTKTSRLPTAAERHQSLSVCSQLPRSIELTMVSPTSCLHQARTGLASQFARRSSSPNSLWGEEAPKEGGGGEGTPTNAGTNNQADRMKKKQEAQKLSSSNPGCSNQSKAEQVMDRWRWLQGGRGEKHHRCRSREFASNRCLQEESSVQGRAPASSPTAHKLSLCNLTSQHKPKQQQAGLERNGGGWSFARHWSPERRPLRLGTLPPARSTTARQGMERRREKEREEGQQLAQGSTGAEGPTKSGRGQGHRRKMQLRRG